MRRKTAVPNCSANVIDRDQIQLMYVAWRHMNVCAPSPVRIALQNVNSQDAPPDKHEGHSISNDTCLAFFALTLPIMFAQL